MRKAVELRQAVCWSKEVAYTTSTNKLINYSREIRGLEKDTIVYALRADYQYKGKGQRGAFWESKANENLLFSLKFFPKNMGAKEQFVLSILVAISCLQVLSLYVTEGLSIKWPNDIYWQDKKIGGILIEHTLSGLNIKQTIAGVGININQEVFESLAPNPISLYQITERRYRIRDIYEQILFVFVTKLQEWNEISNRKTLKTLWHNEFENRLYRKDGIFKFEDAQGVFEAHIVGVNELGNLLLKSEDGIKTYAFKEVRFVI